MKETPFAGEHSGGDRPAEIQTRIVELFRQEEELGREMDEMIRNASDRSAGERRALEEYVPKIEAVRKERNALTTGRDEGSQGE